MKLKFLLLLTIFSFVFVTTFAYAEIPQLISLQGKLSSAATHSPLTGTYSMTFKIYNVATGGTAKWTETQSVSTNKGLFNTMLGSSTPLNLPFNESYWLGIQITPDASEMQPRQKMASVPYALGGLAGGVGGGNWIKTTGLLQNTVYLNGNNRALLIWVVHISGETDTEQKAQILSDASNPPTTEVARASIYPSRAAFTLKQTLVGVIQPNHRYKAVSTTEGIGSVTTISLTLVEEPAGGGGGGTGETLPQGACFFSTTLTTCPSGYERATLFDTRTIQGTSTGVGSTGGAGTHTHTVSPPSFGIYQSGTNWYVVPAGTFTTSSTSSWPPYVNVTVCCKTAAGGGGGGGTVRQEKFVATTDAQGKLTVALSSAPTIVSGFVVTADRLAVSLLIAGNSVSFTILKTQYLAPPLSYGGQHIDCCISGSGVQYVPAFSSTLTSLPVAASETIEIVVTYS